MSDSTKVNRAPIDMLSPDQFAEIAVVGAIQRYLMRRFGMDKRRALMIAGELKRSADLMAVPGEGP